MGTWRQVPAADLPSWNGRLLQTTAHLQQYPFWNESLKIKGLLRPQYLVYEQNGQAQAFVAILRSGLPPAQFGLVRMGPVAIVPALDREQAMTALARFARLRGYMFLRFTAPEAEWDRVVRDSAGAQNVEPFPPLPSPAYELRVPLFEDQNKVLGSFQAIARREIRKASAAGYDIGSTDSPEELAAAWPLFQRLSERKGYRFYRRSLASYCSLMELARAHDCIKLYTARLEGRLIQAILVVRDRDIGHYMAGALDVEALQGSPSPSCLLHWTAMQDLIATGGTIYNLGLWGFGSLHVFKNKFHPTRVDFAPAATIPLNPLFSLWMKAFPAFQKASAFTRRLRPTRARTVAAPEADRTRPAIDRVEAAGLSQSA